MTAKDSDSVYGIYTIGDSSTASSFLKGVITQYEGESYMEGSWYYTSDYTDMAPFVGGTLNVSDNGYGTAKLLFYMEDDRGNTIKGEWKGGMELYPY